MTRWTLCAAIAAAIAAAPAGAAVTMNPGGTGQGLLFPYFTTHNGQSTLLSVQNTTTRTKALKMRVMESYAGAETLTFNIYLPPGGTWQGSIVQTLEGYTDPASLVQSGVACTVPLLPPSGVPFRRFEFEGDDGPQTLDRTREGYVEVIEMGELAATLDASVREPDCNTIRTRFQPNGPWATNPNADVTAPTGGLRGSAVLIDTAGGTSFNYRALAFDGLANAPRQFGLGRDDDLLSPRLTDVRVAAGEDIEVHLSDANGTPVTLLYDADEGYNAISALLANHAASSSFNVEAGLLGRTEWIYSFPTRRAHNSSIVTGTPPPGGIAAPPFAGTTADCETVSVTVADRTGIAAASEPLELCGAAGVVRFSPAAGDSTSILAQEDDVTIETAAGAGTATFDFSEFGDDARRGTPDTDGNCFTGLPVWAMAISAYDNANAQEGRIATFPVEEVAAGSRDIVDCTGG